MSAIRYRLLLQRRLSSSERRAAQAWAAETPGVRYSAASHLAPGGVVTYGYTGSAAGESGFVVPAALYAGLHERLETGSGYVVASVGTSGGALRAIVEHVERRDRGPTAVPSAVGELLRRRRALGLSQTALGERLGIPQQTISRWESGALRIEHPELLALALDALEREHAESPAAQVAATPGAWLLESPAGADTGQNGPKAAAKRLDSQ